MDTLDLKDWEMQARDYVERASKGLFCHIRPAVSAGGEWRRLHDDNRLR
jgi:hypothetical protein